jgi:hypothetical protein
VISRSQALTQINARLARQDILFKIGWSLSMHRTLLTTLALASAFVGSLANAEAHMRQGMGRGMMSNCEPGTAMMCMMGEGPRMGRADDRAMAQRVEQRLAALKTRLKITEAQSTSWDAYAAAVRGAAKSMAEQRQAMREKMHMGALSSAHR